MKKIEANCTISVEFFDLDPMNVVWHGNYLKYLETARCDLLEKLGYTYDDMKQDDSAYPIAKMDLKFIKPAKFKQKLNVKCTLESIEPALLIKYIITDIKSGEKLFKAKSMQLRLDTRTMQTIYTAPQKLKECIEDFNK